ncbi:L,D-transpeptidase [Pseudonocardia asaccharolytica]|uniref:L,D-transpeptidase 5 n=1 Tax=Pseudonocardia asaccharolytica DSM 44247 = NBRC 16224 TaxID=1123024 RepID=A0A511D6G2_9PSEU|nr:Ig-like domain-containing protein [Pseudonocardia asaccharolytica]GEL20362.1 L,D-transpeptidase 5 [Pseudonocardia asaccharolytica DSM 44247 = NBRC 16224]
MTERAGSHLWKGSPRRRRGPLAVVISALVIAALIGGGATAAARSSHHDPAPAPAPAVVAPPLLQPADGTADVSPSALVRAETGAGTLRGVGLTDAEGVAVPGTLSPDQRQWTTTAPLDYDSTYTWSGSAVAPDGTSVPLTGTFHTVAPTKLVKARTNIGDGQTVGIAAPIEVRFNRHLDDAAKATAERALSVQTSVPVLGGWAWLPDTAQGSRVHWRPAEYWTPGATVRMTARLFGLDLGDAGFGAADLTSEFTIGRSQIVKADVNSHRLVVIRDGQQVMDLPASYGLGSDPNRVTRSGIHIVMGKAETVLMSNPAYGYVNLPEHWAVRISNNGEFIHANPASIWAQGERNVTHGCINLSTKNARDYFATALYGDPVEVTGSSVALSAADGDNYDWTIPWEQWRSMSALGNA